MNTLIKQNLLVKLKRLMSYHRDILKTYLLYIKDKLIRYTLKIIAKDTREMLGQI